MGPQPAGDRYPFLAGRLAAEPGFRRRVETAERLGVPPSQLDGREPVEVTEFEYDTGGRLIRAVTVREPLWTDQDRAEVLALAVHRESLCPCGCGHPYAETTSHEKDGPAYAVDRIPCRARLALNEAQRGQAEGDKGNEAMAAARLWSVRKII